MEPNVMPKENNYNTKGKRKKLTTNSTARKKLWVHGERAAHLPVMTVEVSTKLIRFVMPSMTDETDPFLDSCAGPGGKEIRIQLGNPRRRPTAKQA